VGLAHLPNRRSAVTQLITILKFALPVVIAIATLEGLFLAVVMRRNYNWRAWLASLADLLGREYVVLTFLSASLAAPVIRLAWEHRLFTVPLNSTVAVVVLVIGQDFCYYWFHRASHRVRWFWATHAVHHSSNELNLAASFRFGWTGRLTGVAIFYVPMIWLGFAPSPVFIAAGFGLLYQFWVHAEWIPKLGWLEYVLNTPSHHRVHHAANPEYLDHNYGGILIVFDRLFGTFVSERDDVPCRYGLVTPLRSNNPLIIAFHEWAALARDLWRARTWRERLMHVIGPPGWRAGTGDTCALHAAGSRGRSFSAMKRVVHWRYPFSWVMIPTCLPDGQITSDFPK
jgi:sterol desaturase/sphingolipid hydroxylase (fatty acid hydroxylase superfamily)